MSDFLSALILLIIGAALTGILIPYITKQWQLQQKAIEVKYELIEDITVLATEMFLESAKPIAAKAFADYPGPETDIATKVLEWTVRSEVIASRLNLYFREDPLAEKWSYISDLYQKFAMVSSPSSTEVRDVALQKIKTALGKERASYLDWDAYAVSATELSSVEQIEAFNKAQSTLILIIKLERGELVDKILQSRIYGEFSLADYFR